MNALASTALAALGVTEGDHQLGWKDVSVTMADGNTQLVRLRRYATPEDSEAAMRDSHRLGDMRPMLAEMLCGPGTPTFFDSLAVGELARLTNIAVALLLAPESLEQLVFAELQNLTPASAIQLVTEATTILGQEAASHEGGFHG